MNLIQIQEHLKDLPDHVIKSYANGQNPEVPPYMALGELERRSRSEQRAAEPPTQSVKEKLEAKVGSPQGMPQGMHTDRGVDSRGNDRLVHMSLNGLRIEVVASMDAGDRVIGEVVRRKDPVPSPGGAAPGVLHGERVRHRHPWSLQRPVLLPQGARPCQLHAQIGHHGDGQHHETILATLA